MTDASLMEHDPKSISIGLLEEGDTEGANAVFLPNVTSLRRYYTWAGLRSRSFCVATAVTHILICYLGSVRPHLLPQLATALVSFATQALYLWIGAVVIWRMPSAEHLFQHWNHPDRRFIVARDESRESCVVGTVAIERTAEGQTQLWRLRVLPEYRRCGIGVRLNKEAERCAKELGGRTMELRTAPFLQSGIAFYEKHGYRVKGKFQRNFPYPWSRYEAVILEKDLP